MESAEKRIGMDDESSMMVQDQVPYNVKLNETRDERSLANYESYCKLWQSQ